MTDTQRPARFLSRRTLLTGLGVGTLAAIGGTGMLRAKSSQAVAASGASTTSQAVGGTAAAFLSADVIHTVSMTLDPDAFTEMVQTYLADRSKQWLEATVTIDGTEYVQAGVRLKGNSSLKQVSTSSAPESLPWLVRLDKFIEGQHHQTMTTFIVRSSTASALNEAVALDLLSAAGLASERAAYLGFAVNGSDPVLRLAVENLDDAWLVRAFPGEVGTLYKAEASGDYSFRGDEADSYDEVFDIEGGTNDYAGLTSFLQFVNESSDADFAAQIDQHLDTTAFTTYLALENLIDNFDDIDGPGNNSYLWWNGTDMTVVAWDHNLAFGARPGGGGGAGDGGPAAGDPAGGTRPAGGGGNGAPGKANGQSKANPLVTRFTALSGMSRTIAKREAELKADLFSGGVAASSMARWSELLSARADLIEAASLAADQTAITAYLT